jgi:hypothetical protein
MNEHTDIPLGIPRGMSVYENKWLAGQSSHLILHPLNLRVTHLGVRKRRFPRSDHLLPMELVAEMIGGTGSSELQHPRAAPLDSFNEPASSMETPRAVLPVRF